ncbi:MAG TPA: biotin--[acetyl-CoA-carboxylase] ligase [Bacteroidales bacterium]|nr:biotin--[acetyl-CoA-carboxylase] ligase [Bacteroidales bacterium]HPS15661.1 biotin--[acetyl-CoA-carboxylase] ligase [Bacteroidales bacterium]
MIGKNIIRLTETASTNTYAATLLMAEKPVNGTLIFTTSQTNGRGQQNNTWESESGKNLAVSVILYPDFIKPSEQFILNKIISLAVLDFVRKNIPVSMSPKIKWPNDIYVGEKKIAGILIENSISGNRIEYVIAGIGININQEKFSKNIPNPVSLKLVSGKEFIIGNCLDELCESLNARYMQLCRNDCELLNSEYLNNLYRYNLYSKYKVEDSFLFAKIVSVSEFGKLQLENKEGKIFEFAFKEIEYVI